MSCRQILRLRTPKFREGGLNIFFLKRFGRPRDIPTKSQDIPGAGGAPKIWYPWVSRTYRIFWPSPLHAADPHPTRRYPAQKVWVWVPFASGRSEIRAQALVGPQIPDPEMTFSVIQKLIRKRQFVHKIVVHNFCALDPPPCRRITHH